MIVNRNKMLTMSFLLLFMAGFLVNGGLSSQIQQNTAVKTTVRSSQQGSIETCFPLEKGNYWVYHGTYQTIGPVGEIITDTLTWKAEVKDVIDLDKVKLYVIKGFPFLLHSYTFGSAGKGNSVLNTDYVMIRVGSNRFYQYGFVNDQKLKNLKNNTQESAILYMAATGMIDDNSLFLDFPLTIGKEFEFTNWKVTDSNNVTLDDVKGLPHSDTYTVYTIETQNSGNQDISFDFSPHVGIMGFYYNGRGHAGYVRVVEASLKGQ